MSALIILDAVLFVALLKVAKGLVQHYKSDSNEKKLPLPPGPAPKPFIGNLLDVPTGHSWLGWSKLAQEHGPVTRLSLFGMHIISLNTPDAMHALLNQAAFSDRPQVVFGGEMCGWANTLALQRYGEDFKAFRRELHQVLGTHAAIAKFHPLIEVEMRRFLLRVFHDSSRLLEHVQVSAGAIILRIAYGYTIEPPAFVKGSQDKGYSGGTYSGPEDPLVELADRGIAQISYAAQPGNFLVDVLPILRYVPDWLPLTGWKRTARRFRATVTELVEKPYAFVKSQMAEGTAAPSYVSALLEKAHSRAEKESDSAYSPFADSSVSSTRRTGKTADGINAQDDFVIKWSASSLYTGGADTTVSAIQSFFLAMLLHPDVFAKAQAEIDTIVGTDRLPTFEDRERLPYTNALVREVLRWGAVAPMGLPHVPTEDMVFDGYLIPKGSVVMANIWHFLHDPAVYHEPFAFKPERFLSPEQGGIPGRQPEPDVTNVVFGFGRRACPGKELAVASLFMAATMSIAVFDLNKATDLQGNALEPGYNFAPGTITHPEPFKVVATPRSRTAELLIRSVEVEHPWDASDAENLTHLNWRRGTELEI